MKKRIFTMISLLFILLFSCTYVSAAGAIDLTQDKYVKVYEDMTKAVFLNKSSPIVTRESPPYYIIKGEMILNDFTSGTIFVSVSNYFYDYEKQEISSNSISLTAYYSDGSSETSQFPPYILLNSVNTLSRDSVGGTIGDIYFSICYNKFFYKT